MNAPLSMTVSDWLSRNETTLREAGIESARLDCLVLLSDELEKDKSWLLAYSDHELQRSDLQKLNTKITQRAQHTPLAYVRGHVEFYGNNYKVTPDVLVPRPESEAFLDILSTIDSTSYSAIIDVGTGSGALAVSAALLCPSHQIVATDSSDHALAVARHNANMHTVGIRFLSGNLVSHISETDLENSLLLCNLPYVPTDYPINKAASHEPAIALFSGHDGLGHYKELFAQISTRRTKPSYILTESLLHQHESIRELARKIGYHETETSGLVQQLVRL